jgi:hypothetical protein
VAIRRGGHTNCDASPVEQDGAVIGPYRWVAGDIKKGCEGCVDFVSEIGNTWRVWLPTASVKNGTQQDSTVFISLPPLDSPKWLVGLDEAL